MPFGFCKESAWEKEQRGEGGLEEEDHLFRQPGGDSRVPGTFTFRFKKILQEGDQQLFSTLNTPKQGNTTL